ncbi:hypothetical protein RSAG8_07631, partial [Rhizoctonia solani AG-8 WAC10335]
MTIAEFCRLDLVGQVIMMECFQEGDHAFILVHAKGLYPNTPSDQMVWIRLERGLKKNESIGYFQAMFMKTALAYYTATISYQLKSITPPGASPIGDNTLIFHGIQTPVNLKHLVSLLGMVWIRLERGLKKNESIGYFQAMFMKTALAYDTATISYQLKSITPPGASPIGDNTLIFHGIQTPVNLKHLVSLLLKHLVSLLGMMDETASGCSPFKDNCWVFCQAVIDCMEPYQSKAVMVRHPEMNLKHLVSLLGMMDETASGCSPFKVGSSLTWIRALQY